MSPVTENQRDQIIACLKVAAKKILEYIPEPGAKPTAKVFEKPDGSKVTEADYASNEIIVAELERLFPDDGIISEENEIDPRVYTQKRKWFVDPLDGTSSFIDGNDDFSILVGLCVDDVAEFGVMYFPLRDQLAYASRGQGAWLNGSVLKVSAAKKIREQAIYVRHLKLETKAEVYPRWVDSGCAFLNVCSGVFDGLLIKIVNHKAWDLVAPAVILTESGGELTDQAGKPVKFHTEVMDTVCIVASNAHVHKQLLGLLK
jgi:myo-inositol-1(or 4)-monophosphatase